MPVTNLSAISLSAASLSATSLLATSLSAKSLSAKSLSATSLGQTVTFTQQIENAGQSTLVTSTSTVINNATGNQANDHLPLSVGAIVGIAVGALVILALFIAGIFVLKDRRGRPLGHRMLEDNERQMRQAPRCVWLSLLPSFNMLTPDSSISPICSHSLCHRPPAFINTTI